MSMHMHTSGPWAVETDDGIDHIVWQVNGPTRVAVECSHADALLIAQAPAGLALAKHIIAMADDAYLTGHPEWQALVDEARALVAKVAA